VRLEQAAEDTDTDIIGVGEGAQDAVTNQRAEGFGNVLARTVVQQEVHPAVHRDESREDPGTACKVMVA
jgi:hypothetical protein